MSIADVQQTASNPSSSKLEVTACPKLNGLLVKGGGPEVYLVDQGLRRYISNFNLFKPNSAVTTACLETIEEGSPVRANAILIKDHRPPIYLLDVNPNKDSNTLVKRHIVSPEVLTRYQFGSAAIVQAILVDAIPNGEDVVMPPKQS